MGKTFNPPEISTVVQLLLPFEINWKGNLYTLNKWRSRDLNKLAENRKLSKIKIFNIFASALLEGYGTKGTQEEQRLELFNENFNDFKDVTAEKIDAILDSIGYYLKNRKNIPLDLMEEIINKQLNFEWENYFNQAEKQFEDSFPDDPFINIRNVGLKTRDYALANFSSYYCAIDRNLSKILTRTGLILHGYGEFDFGTSASENYHFLQRLIIRFSKDTGWAPASNHGLSPREMDSIFWLFGSEQGICKIEPDCSHCPLKDICITYQNHISLPFSKRPKRISKYYQRQKEERAKIQAWAKEHPEVVQKYMEEHNLINRNIKE